MFFCPFPELINVDHLEPVLQDSVFLYRYPMPDKSRLGVGSVPAAIQLDEKLVIRDICSSIQVSSEAKPVLPVKDCILGPSECLRDPLDGYDAPFVLKVGILCLAPAFVPAARIRSGRVTFSSSSCHVSPPPSFFSS